MRAALRPSRQAAGDGGLGRGPRPVDAGAQGRQALRPRRRRRRLCDVRRAGGDRWRCRPGRPACALRRPDRGLRGIRQPRSAALRRPSGARASARRRWWCASIPAAATTISSGSPPRCAAWSAARSPCACWPKASIPATPRASCRRASGSCAQLLSRLEDEATGEIRPAGAHVADPARPHRRRRKPGRGDSGRRGLRQVPVRGGHARRWPTILTELVLNRTWRPQLAVTGIDGLPPPANAGNVLLPFTTGEASACACRRRSMPRTAARAVKQLLEADPPYGAQVSFDAEDGATGWNAPPLAPWLSTRSTLPRRRPSARRRRFMGEGGSIPFMGMLGEKFPEAQFVITGVLGPHSNAHGPNEFLHSRRRAASPASSPTFSPITTRATTDERQPLLHRLDDAVRPAALRPHPAGAFPARARSRHGRGSDRDRCDRTQHCAAELREHHRRDGAQRAHARPGEPRFL